MHPLRHVMQGGQVQSPDLLAKFARGARAALTVQFCSAVTMYGAQVLLARWLGTTAYGIFDYATSVSIIGAFIAGFGMHTVALKLVSAYIAQQDWARLRGLISGSWRQILWTSSGAAIAGTAVWLWLQATRDLGAYGFPVLLGIWLIPGVALINLQREIIRGYQQIVWALAPSLIGRPLLLVGLAAVWRSRSAMRH